MGLVYSTASLTSFEARGGVVRDDVAFTDLWLGRALRVRIGLKEDDEQDTGLMREILAGPVAQVAAYGQSGEVPWLDRAWSTRWWGRLVATALDPVSLVLPFRPDEQMEGMGWLGGRTCPGNEWPDSLILPRPLSGFGVLLAKSAGFVEHASHRQLDEASAIREFDNLVADRLCVVCLGAPKELRFSPCGHECCCPPCGRLIMGAAMPCPLCREGITSAVRV